MHLITYSFLFIAASLLFGYDPVLPLNKEGRAKRTEIVKFGRGYHMMMTTILQEAPMYEAAEWQRSLSAPAAWNSFMDRCYNSYVEVRGSGGEFL